MNLVKTGSEVQYEHPDWGPSTGRVIDVRPDAPDGGAVLVQDLSPGGAREWWPLAQCVSTNVYVKPDASPQPPPDDEFEPGERELPPEEP